MSDSAERLVTAFAKGLMLGLLEARSGTGRTPSRRRARTDSPPAHVPYTPSMKPEDLLAAAHEALRNNGGEPEQLDLEQVAEAMQRARAEAEVLSAVRTQPGLGEDESQSWAGVG